MSKETTGKLIRVFRGARYAPAENLAENIWRKLAAREKFSTRMKFWGFAALGLASLSGLVPAFTALLSDLRQSGFYEYFSLLFSDTHSIAVYWKEFAFSLAESLPLESMILALLLAFIFFASLKYFSKQINRGPLRLALK